MPNFDMIDNDKMTWETAVEFNPNGRLAVSNCEIVFKSAKTSNVTVKCNLIGDDIYNPDGVLFSQFSPGRQRVHHNPSQLEFWNVDSARPRLIMFTLDGLTLEDIYSFRIVIAIE